MWTAGLVTARRGLPCHRPGASLRRASLSQVRHPFAGTAPFPWGGLAVCCGVGSVEWAGAWRHQGQRMWGRGVRRPGPGACLVEVAVVIGGHVASHGMWRRVTGQRRVPAGGGGRRAAWSVALRHESASQPARTGACLRSACRPWRRGRGRISGLRALRERVPPAWPAAALRGTAQCGCGVAVSGAGWAG